MNLVIKTLLPGALLFCLLGAPLDELIGQNCFDINPGLSKIILNPSPDISLPSSGDTISIPCNKTVANLSLAMNFQPGVETYFEDNAPISAFLTYRSSTTIILPYDKSNNTFTLPNSAGNLGDGLYEFSISANPCAPPNGTCTNCTLTYAFVVTYNKDANLSVDITTQPDPAVLTCVPGDSVILTGQQVPNNGFKVQWAVLIDTAYQDIAGATKSTYVTTTAGTYRYSMTGPGGCSASNFVAVNPPLLPTVKIIPDTQAMLACSQKITGLTVGNAGSPGNIQYDWSASGTGILLSGGTTASPLVAAPGVYTVQVTRSDNSCTATASVQVIPGVVPTVNVEISRNPDIGKLDCRNPEIKLQASASLSTGTSPFEFVWSDGSTGAALKADAPGQYTVIATATAIGCKGAASVFLTQDISLPDIRIVSARDTICAGESITLTALTQEPTTYLWDSNTTNNNFTAIPEADGINDYSVTVTTEDNGCTGSATKIIYRVLPPEVFCAQDYLTVNNGDQASLDCTTSGDRITWVADVKNVRNIPASGQGPILDQTFALTDMRAPGSVGFSLYGLNAGCASDRVDVFLEVLPNSKTGIYLPEIITPNGDGVQDYWGIVVPETVLNPDAYRLTLFNRYGARVFEGSLAVRFNANDYPDGTYYYVLDQPDGIKINGAVTILRRP